VLIFFVEVENETVVTYLVVLLAHLLEEIKLLIALLVGAACVAVLLLARYCHSGVCCVLCSAEKVVHLLVKVLLILDRLDAAVFNFDVAIVLYNEAAHGTRL
jgi:hypothetical protein